MCDYFWQRPTSADGQGDLSDVVRGAAAATAFPLTTSLAEYPFGDLAGLPGQGGVVHGEEVMSGGPPCGVGLSQLLQMSRTDVGAGEDGGSLAAGGEARDLAAHVPPGNFKRRKNQAKKVVCIPAATAAPGANGRASTSGEVVPSDLWAWRKYGQKPIRGSPYPRGYYRCSSSKGCSARKQVERSRTDPSMLVITYTSDHNHPWPTHRNALAGSTRPFASSENTYAAHIIAPPPTTTSSSSSQCQRPQGADRPGVLQAEPNKTGSATAQVLKQEDVAMGGGCCKRSTADVVVADDLFVDFAELEAVDHGGFSEEKGEKAAFDPFTFFDWVGL